MKDVRIIVVPWNVEKLLDRCLRSLPNACKGLDWDVVIVDNNSADGSVACAERFRSDMAGGVEVIANPDNRGFAKACNQGMVGSDARYTMLLNPDTECPERSITDLIHCADQFPTGGIFGPMLKNSDGSYQESVRSFPTFSDQAGILLKLHHLFPKLPIFKKYFSPNFGCKDTSEKSQATNSQTSQKNIFQVDQVMGAGFLIRKEVIDLIGGLDERYFIWFEEVDFCRMAKEAGWPTMYVSSVSIIHHSGQSFAQVMGVKKQRMFSESMVKYFAKWDPGWRANVIRLLKGVSIVLSQLIQVMKVNPWVLWMLGIVFFEIISRATVFHPYPRAIATIIAGGLMAVITMRKPNVGIVLLLTELMLGSKGALLKIPRGFEVDGGVSLRMVLTGAFLFGWAISFLPNLRRNMEFGKEQIEDEGRQGFFHYIRDNGKPWIAVFLLIAYASLRGLSLGNERFSQDVNAWLYLALLIPVILVSRAYGVEMIRSVKNAVIASLLWLPIKTLGLLYIFSHGIKSMSQPFYLWVRRTGVGEITLVTGNLFRIFIQSQVYAIFGILFTVSRFIFEIGSRLSFWVLTASIVSVLISLSRSFWMGLFFGLITIVVLCARMRFKSVLKTISVSIGSVVVALGILFAVVAFPYPRIDVGSLSTLFGSRGSTTDAASESRWNLLPVLVDKIKEAPVLGHGFGATVMYQTKDPRILAQNPEGWYTTHAFEWGWLEFWIKFGILGIPVMLWLLISIGWRIWNAKTEKWIKIGFISSLVTLGVIHVFTPYLNHPLGFGFLLLTEGYLAVIGMEEIVDITGA
ncbi:MAG: glycosyltransferase [bacterium]|nr:glycosyltransferase [bacterium]